MGLVGFAHMGLMWVKQCHKSAMTGNGNHTTYKFIVMTGGWFFLVLPALDIMLIFSVVHLVHSNHQHASAYIGHITQEEIERIWGARDTEIQVSCVLNRFIPKWAKHCAPCRRRFAILFGMCEKNCASPTYLGSYLFSTSSWIWYNVAIMNHAQYCHTWLVKTVVNW